jgi:hypothetical protein
VTLCMFVYCYVWLCIRALGYPHYGGTYPKLCLCETVCVLNCVFVTLCMFVYCYVWLCIRALGYPHYGGTYPKLCLCETVYVCFTSVCAQLYLLFGTGRFLIIWYRLWCRTTLLWVFDNTIVLLTKIVCELFVWCFLLFFF